MALASIERLEGEHYRVRFYARGLDGKLSRAYDVECRWPYVLVALGLKTSPALAAQPEPLACVRALVVDERAATKPAVPRR